MIKVHLNSWRVTEIAKNNPAVYDLMFKNKPALGAREDRIKEKIWEDFTFYANGIDDLPDELLNGAEFSRLKPLMLYSDNGDIAAQNLSEAFNYSQVHLPGNELLYITEVSVITNACTDELRNHLIEGWKILAICPQVGQRRPDYVLGKVPITHMRPERQKDHPPVIKKPYNPDVGIPYCMDQNEHKPPVNQTMEIPF